MDTLVLTMAEDPVLASTFIVILLCWAAFNTVSTFVLAYDISKLRKAIKRVLPSKYWNDDR